jgi:group I intron endonuclease
MVVYKTTNLINGKQYIGRDMYNNPKYLGSGRLLRKAIKKYGIENFKKEILQECKTIDELTRAEEYWIRLYDAANNPSFYNLLDGSTGGDSLSNHPNLDSIKSKIRNARKLQVIQHSEETKLKISEAQRGEKAYWYGKTHSLESNKKRSDSLKGRIKTTMVCPHCNKEGSIAGIKRWHLDNCTVVTGLKHTATNKQPWNKGKTKHEFPQMSRSGVKKNNIPWNKK